MGAAFGLCQMFYDIITLIMANYTQHLADIEIAREFGKTSQCEDADGDGECDEHGQSIQTKEHTDLYLKELGMSKSGEKQNFWFFKMWLMQDNCLSCFLPCYGW